MRHVDIAVVGSGIGGSFISALNQKRDVVLFEQDYNLGGCASTFKHKGHYYNAGATTLVGYEHNHPIKKMFNQICFTPDLKPSSVAMEIRHGSITLDRSTNFDQFLKDVDESYHHINNALFWKKLRSIDEKFWQLYDEIHYQRGSLKGYFRSFKSLWKLKRAFGAHIFKSAHSFIKESLPDISDEYQAFIDAQLLITVQATSKEIPLLSLALGLCYPFHQVYYANGGMGQVIEDMLHCVDVRKHEKVVSIQKEPKGYKIESTKGCYLANNVILNSTVYESAKFFKDQKIQKYYKRFKRKDQSAFVLYIKLRSKEEFLHHYQIILNQIIPNTISHSFFVSFSDPDDERLSKDGYSITISTHTQALFWKGLSKDEYKKKKEATQAYILKRFLEHFDTIDAEDIVDIFSATSITFNRYIGRLNCGGDVISIRNLLKFPSTTTPFKGLYNVGDTLFSGQGWPGVALGVKILDRIINERS